MITGAQIRAARKLLGWTRAELAARAFGVSSHTIESAERERTRIAPTDAQLASKTAFRGKSLSVEFDVDPAVSLISRRPIRG
jgi:DNA-binding XRE family transcriptional regulator